MLDMTESLKEQLSACLDGELPSDELAPLLRQMEQDPQLRDAAARYAAISAAIASAPSITPSPGFASKIAEAIANEPLPTAKVVPLRRPNKAASALSWLRPAVSVAMAAGIATFAVLIVNRPDSDSSVPLAQAPAIQAPVSISPTPPAVATWTPEQLANYVVAHSEYSSPLGRTMVLNGLLAADPEPSAAVDPSADTPDSQTR